MKLACVSLAAGLAFQAQAADRDVQIKSVDFNAGVIELHNYSDVEAVQLDGWRFCSHSTQFVRVYTGTSSLVGRALTPGSSLFIHLNNDADEADEINASDVGSFASPFSQAAYGLNIYSPMGNAFINFSDPTQMVDHLQWSVDGIDNTTADERSDEAQTAGLWINQSLWISTSSESSRIQLKDDSGGALLHGPDDYIVSEPCPADINSDGVLDFFDVSAFLTAFGSGDLSVDFNGDGVLDFFDVSAFLGAFSAGCP